VENDLIRCSSRRTRSRCYGERAEAAGTSAEEKTAPELSTVELTAAHRGEPAVYPDVTATVVTDRRHAVPYIALPRKVVAGGPAYQLPTSQSSRTMAPFVRMGSLRMEVRTVATITLYVIVGFVIYVWLAIPVGTGWDGNIHWGDAGAWAGAVSSFMAVVVALRIAGQSDRKEARRDEDMASIIATALCDELRGNRGELEHAMEWRDATAYGPVERAGNMIRALSSLDITAFRLFRTDLRSLGAARGEAVATAYASLARCKALERHMNRPAEADAKELWWCTEYLKIRGAVVDDINHEVCRAIRLLWPISRDRVGTEPPLSNAAEATNAVVLRARRAKSAHTSID
jgi:hypothetical protein